MNLPTYSVGIGGWNNSWEKVRCLAFARDRPRIWATEVGRSSHQSPPATAAAAADPRASLSLSLSTSDKRAVAWLSASGNTAYIRGPLISISQFYFNQLSDFSAVPVDDDKFDASQRKEEPVAYLSTRRLWLSDLYLCLYYERLIDERVFFFNSLRRRSTRTNVLLMPPRW